LSGIVAWSRQGMSFLSAQRPPNERHVVTGPFVSRGHLHQTEARVEREEFGIGQLERLLRVGHAVAPREEVDVVGEDATPPTVELQTRCAVVSWPECGRVALGDADLAGNV
jgi:hypothetical protein